MLTPASVWGFEIWVEDRSHMALIEDGYTSTNIVSLVAGHVYERTLRWINAAMRNGTRYDRLT